jgi:hypothetical protein
VRVFTNISRTLVLATLAASALTIPTSSAVASDVGVRVGYYFDAEAVSFGMEMLSPLSFTDESWYFNPNLEVAMGDRRDIAAFNFDFHYDFQTQSNLAVWAGAGPAIYMIDRDPFSNDTDVDPGINLLLGFGAKTGTVRPFVQGKGVLMDNSEAAIAFGVRF